MPNTNISVNPVNELQRLEAVVESGLATFREVGQALRAIKDSEWWSAVAGYGTWGEYCKERWGFTRQRAHQILAASEMSTIVDAKNEGHARELRKLPEADRADAYQEAVNTAPGGKVTAAHVRETVAKWQNSEPTEEPEDTPSPLVVTDALGQPVPKALEGIFTDGLAEIKAIVSDIARLQRRIKALEGQPVADNLSTLQRTIFDLRNVYSAIKSAKPYALCPAKLPGERGKRQQKIGWLTEAQYKQLPEDLR